MQGPPSPGRRSFGLSLLSAAVLVVIAALSEVSLFYGIRPLALASSTINLGLAGVVFWSAWKIRKDWLRMRLRERWMSTTLRSIGDGVIATDTTGRIVLMNHVAEDLTGWTEDEARHLPLATVVTTLDRITRETIPSPIDEVVRESRAITMMEPLLLGARDGAERQVLCNAAPIRSEDKIDGVVFVFRDVTQRELAESAFRASQEMFRLISDHISDYIAVLDLEGRRLYTSASYGRLLAPPRELYLTSSFAEIHPDDRERIRAVFAETLTTRIGQRTEYRLIDREGKIVELESVGTLITNATGEPDKMLVVSRDIGARRRAEERVRNEKEFSDTLINSMPGIFYLYDARRKILRWNKNLETITEYNSEEFATLDPLSYFPDDEKPLVHERMLKCFAEGSADIEVNLLSRSGRRTPFYVTGYRLEVNGVPCMLGIGINITARRTAEEALRATMHRLERQNTALARQANRSRLLETKLDEALRTVAELAARTLEVGRVSIWFYNENATSMRCVELFETAAGEHSFGAALRAADYPAYFQALGEEHTIAAQEARTDPRTREFTVNYLEPNGINSVLDAPIRGGGRVVGVVCHEHTGEPREWQPDEQSFAASMADLVAMSLEVARRREAETALREAHAGLEIKVANRTRDLARANERLKELDRLKSEFLATMSHELRTPLNSIIGFTGILRQGLAGPVNPEQAKQLGMVQTSGRHLLGMINDLLDLSRIESGKMEVYPEDFPVADLLAEVTQTLAPLASQKKLRLESSLEPENLRWHSDRKKCFQIFLNLANNAVKFTDTGLVRLTVRAVEAGLEFAVQDTGIGIKPENMAHLFEAFRQVDGSARRVYEGTGLGLYLCKQLATLLCGHLTAESEFGIGSRFAFIVPQADQTP